MQHDGDPPAPALIEEVVDGVATLTLNRPAKMNSLDPELACRLADAWDRVDSDPTIHVVILTGAGERAFCVGADLARLMPLVGGRREPDDEWDERVLSEPELINRAMLRRSDMSIPIIAAVQGYVLGGGMELLLGTDLRVAAEGSRFGLPEVTRGLVPAGGGLARLGNQITWARAAEIILLGEHFSAADAHGIGLVNRVVPPAELMSTAQSLADRIAQNGPLAVRTAKRALQGTVGLPLAEALVVESTVAAAVSRSDDAAEGARAFTERRAPRFTGK